MVNPCLKISKKDQALLNYYLIAAADVGILDSKFRRIQIEPNLPKLEVLVVKLPNYQQFWLSKDQKKHSNNLVIQSYSTNFYESWYLLCASAVRDYSNFLAHTLINQETYFRGSYNQLKKITPFTIDPVFFKVLGKKIVTKISEVDSEFANHKFTNIDVINWVPVFSVFADCEVYLPAQLWFEYFPTNWFEEKKFISRPQSGVGVAKNQLLAFEAALISVLKNHAFMKHWYFDQSAKEIIVDDHNLQSEINRLLENIDTVQIMFQLYQNDYSNLYHIGCYLINQAEKFPAISFGLASSLNLKTAMLSAVKAALNTYINNFYQFLESKNKRTIKKQKKWCSDLIANLNWYACPKNFDKNYQAIKNRCNQQIAFSELLSQSDLQKNLLLSEILANLKAKNCDIFVMDITAPEIKDYYSVIKILIPQLLPLMFPSIPYDQHPNFKKQACAYEIHPLSVEYLN